MRTGLPRSLYGFSRKHLLLLLLCVIILPQCVLFTMRRPYEPRYTTDLNPDTCTVDCRPGVPCQYEDELDLRVIVITYNRPASLRKCLQHVTRLDTLADRVGVEIWIDRGKDGSIDPETLDVSRDFQTTWTGGRACVHQQDTNVKIMGQWIDTWRPKENSREMALFVEDDVDISTHAYRWLKAVRAQTSEWRDLAGYTLQSENVNFVRPRKFPASGPETDSVYMYVMLGTWGFSPTPQLWTAFQDWFHKQRTDPNFAPNIPGTEIEIWYNKIQDKDSFWGIWFIHYCSLHKMYTLYPNLATYTGRWDVQLEYNRREDGLHYHSWFPSFTPFQYLLTDWSDDFVRLPADVIRYDFGGEALN